MDHGADNVSLDLLSRLLMDMQCDSTRIIDSLVSEYQRSLLDIVFYGDRNSSMATSGTFHALALSDDALVLPETLT